MQGLCATGPLCPVEFGGPSVLGQRVVADERQSCLRHPLLFYSKIGLEVNVFNDLLINCSRKLKREFWNAMPFLGDKNISKCLVNAIPYI